MDHLLLMFIDKEGMVMEVGHHHHNLRVVMMVIMDDYGYMIE